MQNDKKKEFLKIKDLIITSIKEGKDKEDLILETSPNWFRYFYYSKDPLNLLNPEVNFQDEQINLFINREAEIKVLSNYIGISKNLSNNIHIAIIGPIGIGKHTTMKIIAKTIKESFKNINFEFYNLKSSYDYKNGKELTDIELKDIDYKNLDVRIVSCTGKNRTFFCKRITDYKKNTKVTFSIWHMSEYPKEFEIFVDKEIYFRNYKKTELIEILEKRIEYSLILNSETKKYFKDIKEILIPKIAEFSKGNLKIIFDLFREIHQQARIQELKSIPINLIDYIMEKYLNIKNQKLTGKDKDIIKYFLLKDNMKYITTSNLVEDLNFDRTVAWKYLESLTKKGVLNKIKYGNPSKYEINEIFLSFYEELLKKEFLFKK